MGVSQWLIQNFRSGGGGGGGGPFFRERGGGAHSFGNKGGGPRMKKKIFATLQMVPLNLQRLLLTPPNSTESNQEE